MSLTLVILIQASFYSLLGLGYVLIYRATRVLNLAHGDLMVFGAYAFYQGLVISNGNLWAAVGCSLVAAYAFGVIVYNVVMRPLAGYPVAVGVLATIALGIFLRSVATLIWSGQTRYPIEYFKGVAQPFSLPAGLTISGIDALIVVAAAMALIAIPWALQSLPVGIEVVASSGGRVARPPRHLADLTEADVQNIIALRPKWGLSEAPSPEFQSPVWLASQGGLSLQTLKSLEKIVTTKSQVFHIQVVGQFQKGNGPTSRVEAIVDQNFGRPRIVYYRDLSELGRTKLR
mgnify:CR=1 FL=1